ncbi:MAG TPA: AraC family ligand binding domain-containing protein, partial [Firmicutes bacterium]|nr:AraC family ligand binding domain-containing protein [Bacillota bacterium]
MKNTTEAYNPSVLHEEIVMPNADLPINFIEHHRDATGPFCILHWHSEIELAYVSQGVVVVNCNAGTVEAGPGDMVFINSNEPHDYHILAAPIELFCCTIGLPLFQGRYITGYESQFSPGSSIAVFQNHVSGDEQINRYFLT